MKNFFAGALLCGLTIITMPVLAADWQPMGVSLKRPVPMAAPAQYDTAIRPVSYVPLPPQPTFRGKIEIPRIVQRTGVGLMPVMQGDVPEAGPPRSEEIPLMPQKLGGVPDDAASAPQPFPDTAAMPYADNGNGSVMRDGNFPQGNYPLIDSGSMPPGESLISVPCDLCNSGNACCGTACPPYASCGLMNHCGSCNSGCGGCDCYPRPHAWISAEYLLWNFSRQNVPPLLTTSNQDDNGILGRSSTRVLYGEDQLNNDNWHPGLRVALGWWCRQNPCWGFDMSAFYIFRDNNTYSASSGGTPLLARPFFDVADRAQDSVIVAGLNDGDPNRGVRGVLAIRNDSRFYGADLNLRRKWCCGCNYHWDVLIGYRHLRLDEGIEIDDFEAFTDDTTAIAFDRFHTRNSFHGGQLGIDGEYRLAQRWSLGTTIKVAFGAVQQNVSINGFTNFTDDAGANSTLPGGILALNSNIGSYSRNRFAVAPELQLKLHYHLNENCRVFVGYNLLMISSVVRPGDQIDTTIDSERFPPVGTPTAAQPAVLFKTTPFIAQGVNVGLICNY